MGTRETAVAGLFYPLDPQALRTQVQTLLAEVEPHHLPIAGPVKALIAPHAGYLYSGATAACAYALVKERNDIEHVVLLGPSHRVAFRGRALSSATSFATPLGDVPVPRALATAAAALAPVTVFDAAHTAEHSLEVHLPFLQIALPGVPVLPLVTGDTTPEEVESTLAALTNDDARSLVIVSTDLSHFLDYASACTVDRRTTRAIEALETTVTPEQACGCRALNGLLRFASSNALSVNTLDVRNSGDTAGAKDRVVGYGSYALH